MSVLRPIAAPFVVAPPAGARVRTRLKVSEIDAEVLGTLGRYLGSFAGSDLAQRCIEGKLTAKERADSRRDRKRAIPPRARSRWAGAITRTSEDAWQPPFGTSSQSAGHSGPASIASSSGFQFPSAACPWP